MPHGGGVRRAEGGNLTIQVGLAWRVKFLRRRSKGDETVYANSKSFVVRLCTLARRSRASLQKIK